MIERVERVEELPEPRYVRIPIVLDRQPKEVPIPFPADFIAFIDVSEVDPNKVFVAFNKPMIYIPLSKVVIAKLEKPVVKRIWLIWSEDQSGKRIEVYFAGAPSIQIAANLVTIAGDYLGLARDETLKSILAQLDVKLSTRASEDTLSKINSRVQPILKASLINASVTANTDILSSPVVPSRPPSMMRIYVSFDSSGVLSVVRTIGSTTVVEQLNAGNALNANCAYAFDVPVVENESINLRYSVNATLLRLVIVEVPMMVS